MARYAPSDRLFGCDVDREAIAWDKTNIFGPEFSAIDPYPPTHYPSGFFDLVYGVSVMTHLDEETQILWLSELARITAPGAVLALSIIGSNLRKTNMPAEVRDLFERRGFATFVPPYSSLLTGSAPDKYYKETYHSLAYVSAVWGRYFEVLACFETGHQDIVVLRSRDG